MSDSFANWHGLVEISPLERLQQGLGQFDFEKNENARRLALASLFDAIGRLLTTWTLQRVDEEAWLFSITWSDPPSIVADHDLAFELITKIENLLYAELGRPLSPSQPRDGNVMALTQARNRLAALSKRVEFLMTRAADLRMSRQLDDLERNLGERLGAALAVDLERLSTLPVADRPEALDRAMSKHRLLDRLISSKAPEAAKIVAAAGNFLRKIGPFAIQDLLVAGIVNVASPHVWEWLKSNYQGLVG